MQPENSYTIDLVKTGQLGHIEFTRLTLATTAEDREYQRNIIKETLIFIRALHQEQIDSLYAARTKDQQTFLITLQFRSRALCHLFFDFSYRDETSFIKRFEVTGTSGSYQFNNQSQPSLDADFLTTGPYRPRYQLSVLDNIWLEEILAKIDRSCEDNTLAQSGEFL